MHKQVFFVYGLTLVMVSFLFAQQAEKLVYHPIKTDKDGVIIPWYDHDPGKSYDHILQLVWTFWDTMRTDPNGLPYYMNHQVWNPHFNDPRGIGGDQLAMALSSWRLYYAYSGNEKVKENMCFIADYYLTHGLSPADCKWPDLPFPYNTLIYSGYYDGDMILGRNFTQPDKAGSFGLELVHLYKTKQNENYLDAAIRIANTLAKNTGNGNADYSPLPYKVNVITGEPGLLRTHDFTGTSIDTAGYTSNWVPTLQLFLDLIELERGDVDLYRSAFDRLLNWLKKYPLVTNKWGPFFEDVGWWSETQINAMTFARFMMEHPEYFPEASRQVRGIIDWVKKMFANYNWQKYGVVVTNEQTVYPVPGESHTSRQGADELLYTRFSGDSSFYLNGIRQLTWATYAVDVDGKNCFPFDEPWLTDGYGDYVRHYLRAMATVPELAPAAENHILSSTSVIQQADYKGNLKKFLFLEYSDVDTNRVLIYYRAYDDHGTEILRMTTKPARVLINTRVMPETNQGEGFEWKNLSQGGVLTIHRKQGNKIILLK